MRGVIKVVLILISFLLILFIIAYFNIEDNTPNNSFESIEDTKFPISDYLYFTSPQKEKLKEDKENIEDIIIDNNDVYSNANNEEQLKENTDNAKEDDSNKENSLKDIFNNAQETLQSLTTNNLDKDNKENKELNDFRSKLLSSRNSNIAILTKEKINKTVEIEYGVDSFSNLSTKDLASNEHKLYRTLSAMKMIPAILITNISSDIGGKVIAQVEEDIFAEMGKAILIPKGSKVLGNYASNNKIGEYRLNIAWNRILTPQGINIILTDAYGADLAGAMGLIGNLDSKYLDRYGIPFFLSTLSNGLILTLNNLTSKDTNGFLSYMNSNILSNMQGDISQIMAEIIREQVKIQPTIRIEKGSRIFITSSKDIFFPIPKKGEVMAKFFNEVKLSDEENNNFD